MLRLAMQDMTNRKLENTMLNKNYQKLHIAAITIVSEMPTRTALVYCAVIPLEIMENATKISKGNDLLNFEKIYVQFVHHWCLMILE